MVELQQEWSAINRATPFSLNRPHLAEPVIALPIFPPLWFYNRKVYHVLASTPTTTALLSLAHNITNLLITVLGFPENPLNLDIFCIQTDQFFFLAISGQQQ